MTAPQPRRTRRRAAPGPSLPRPGAASPAEASAARQRRSISHHREHHVTTDYGYVHRDLIAVAATGAVTLAFVVGMSFLL
ncbi:MAG: hypothetical protein DYG91_05565 [Chloroflexi bacterium CFX7]|nr:hypothetical protein [Chloroflexi bacterium CFX7]MCK6565209.1 hypothetical protein [Dehalococcoidia bacterium]RIL01969.1 MAG: hypothetical protein DCC78_09000 [bacterium]